MPAKTTHGGAREGAGSPPKHDKPMTRYNVMLDDATVIAGRLIGQGNLSEGIRLAVAAMAKKRRKQK